MHSPMTISPIHRLCRTALLAVLSLGCAAHDAVVTRPIAPGVEYTTIRRTDGPWEIRVLRIRRDEPLVRVAMALGMGAIAGVEQLSKTIARETRADDSVVAAVNGDFFAMAGRKNAGALIGLAVRDGELIMAARNRPAFIVMADGEPSIGVFNSKGGLKTPAGDCSLNSVNQAPSKNDAAVITQAYGRPVRQRGVLVRCQGLPIRPNGTWRGRVTRTIEADNAVTPQTDEVVLVGKGTAAEVVAGLAPGMDLAFSLETPALGRPMRMAVGGGPELLRHGEILPDDAPGKPRHPRTLIGLNESEVLLVTVDGRQAGWSIGMTTYELALLLEELGCTDALNLDGGGSTTAWVRGKVVNRPSDGGERRIANSVLVRSRAPHGGLARLTVRPERIVALPNASVPLRVWPTDEWYNPVEADLSQLVVSSARATPLARWRGGSLAVGASTGQDTLRLTYTDSAEATAQVALSVVDGCASVQLLPSSASLCPGESVSFTARGLGADGSTPVSTPPNAQRWQLAGAGLEQTEPGTFRATTAGAATTVAVTIGEATGTAAVQVAGDDGVEEFEADAAVRFATYPETDAVSGNLKIASGQTPNGTRYCRMVYDLGEPERTRAAYVRLDRQVGTALKLTFLARAEAVPAPWLRVAVVDGNGSRQTLTAAGAVDWGNEWRRLEVRLPDGIKPPVTWQSIYVVATAGRTSKGTLEVDDLRAFRVGKAAE